ncbi:hypothetical protein PMI18_00774 [Pseudomonas sp. GM102]|nr:hypothetical protein PMI18_00774 [Pseudomonas sp. GM102]
MITVTYESAALAIPAKPAKPATQNSPGAPAVPATPAVQGWTGFSPQGPNKDTKMSETEHTRIINEAINIVKSKSYTNEELSGNASKDSLRTFKEACDDQDNNVLRVIKGIHQRLDAHIRAKLVKNGVDYHLNVMGSSATGDFVSEDDIFHWKIVSISAKVDNTEELLLVDNRVGLFKPEWRRNSISFADYNAQIKREKAAAENAEKQKKSDLIIKVISQKLQCVPVKSKDFSSDLLSGSPVKFRLTTKDKSEMTCIYNLVESSVEGTLENGQKKKCYL